jgi:hypothetical protein
MRSPSQVPNPLQLCQRHRVERNLLVDDRTATRVDDHISLSPPCKVPFIQQMSRVRKEKCTMRTKVTVLEKFVPQDIYLKFATSAHRSLRNVRFLLFRETVLEKTDELSEAIAQTTAFTAMRQWRCSAFGEKGSRNFKIFQIG